MDTTHAPDGTTIAYTDSGDGDGTGGEQVVLVHGITESHASLAPVAERLESLGHRVVALDLRGHGESGSAPTYALDAMVTDVAAVIDAAGLDRPHLVGHSLGGAVVSAAGAVLPVRSVTNIDQALRLGSFKDMLMPAEPLLRDEASFAAVIDSLFAQLAGDKLSEQERARVSALRRPRQDVVLGVWELIFTESVESIDATIDAALAGYGTSPTPFWSLFGADPGDDYAAWLQDRIPGAVTELWPDLGHYPHLVDPDRFIDGVQDFWRRSPA